MRQSWVWALAVLSSISFASDLGFRFKNGKCLNDAGIEGHNPGFLGECGDLRKANLPAVDLRGKNLKGADFSGANLKLCKCSTADFTHADFTEAELSDADFSYSDLTSANLSSARGQTITFLEANLSRATLKQAKLRESNFEGAILDEVIIEYTLLYKATFQGAKIRNVRGNKALLRASLFRNSDLTGSDLREAELQNARFEFSILDSVDFSKARLQSAYILESSANGAKFFQAQYDLDTSLPLTEEQKKQQQLISPIPKLNFWEQFQPAYLAGGMSVIITPHTGTVVQWLTEGKIVYSFDLKGVAAGTPTVLGDGKTVFASTIDGRFYWLRDGQAVGQFKLEGDVAFTCFCGSAVLSDGETVINTSFSKVLWLKNGKLLSQYDTQQMVLHPSVLADGETVVVAQYDRIFWLRNGEKLFSHPIVDAYNYSVQVLTDGETLVMVNRFDVLWLKDGRKLSEVSVAFGSPPKVLSDGKTIVTADSNGKVFWFKDGKELAKFDTGDFFSRPFLTLLPDGVTIVTDGYKNNQHKLYFVQKGTVLSEMDILTDVPEPVALRDGQTIVHNFQKKIWWIRGGERIAETTLPDGFQLSKMFLLPDGVTVIAFDANKRVAWLRDGQVIGALQLSP